MEVSADLCPLLMKVNLVVRSIAGSVWKCSVSEDINSHNSIFIKKTDYQACRIHSLWTGWICFTALLHYCVPRCHQKHVLLLPVMDHVNPCPPTTGNRLLLRVLQQVMYLGYWQTKSERRKIMPRSWPVSESVGICSMWMSESVKLP